MSAHDLVAGPIDILLLALIAYSALINSSFLFLTLAAGREFFNYMRLRQFAGYDDAFAEPIPLGISVLMPAYNESLSIVDSVLAMSSIRYPDFEIIVIDDGSTDGTAERLIEAFDMRQLPLVVPSIIPTRGAVIDSFRATVGAQTLVLIRKHNGGKADALNTGVNAARKGLVCMVDADSILDPDALLHVARPFAEDPSRVVASGGVVRVANGSTIQRGRVTRVRMPGTWLGRIQVVEYLRGFLVGRSAWAAAGGLLIISGAFGLFRRDVIERMGGLDPDCIGEDAELVVRMHRWMRDTGFDGRVVFVPEPVAWTEAPSTLRSLSAQRRRWHRGLTEILTKHRRMIANPRYGVVGMIALPWFVFFELLAPVVEFVGFLFFLAAAAMYAGQELGFVPDGLVNGQSVLLLFFASVVYATVTTWAILLAEEISFRRYRGTRDLLLSMVASVEENFGFRQLTAWWRIWGLWDAVRGSTRRWGNMERRGFSAR